MSPDSNQRSASEQILARVAAPESDSAPMPRVLIVAAHPDDETLAIGGRMARFGGAHFLHVTDGAPLDGADAAAHGFPSLAAYREARFAELNHALATAGIPSAQSSCLAIPDQQAALRLVEISRAIADRIARFAPEAVLTHAYEGGHPDHDACAFAVQHAVALHASRTAPVIIESPFYHSGPNGMETEAFLPLASPAPTEVSHLLSNEERGRKRQRLACFRSQRETLNSFPLRCELYRLAPAYDFTTPPHTPPVFYDQHPWGMTSSRFCQLAAAAQQELSARRASPNTEPVLCR